MAYASSQHLPTVEDYVPDVLKAKAQGFRAYKIHPGGGQHATGPAIPSYIGHMEEIREVRKAVGDEFVLMHDPVQRYNRFEAMTVGRLLDELNYAWFEDPVRTTDQEGLIEICAALNLPIHVGEFIYSIADFADYIKNGRARRGSPDCGQRWRNFWSHARGIVGRCAWAGMHAAQLGQCSGYGAALPRGACAAELLVVRDAVPRRICGPARVQL